MDFDDLLSVPVVTTARVGRKFQLKGKPPARKIPTSITETTDQQARPASTSYDQANDRSVEQLDAFDNTTVTCVDVTGTEKPSRNNEVPVVEDLCNYNTLILAPELYGSLPPTCDTSNCGVNYSYNVVQSTEENAGISSNICYDDENDRSTTIAENAEGNHVKRNSASPSTDGANALHLETSSEEDHASFQYVISEDNDVLFDTENLEDEGVGAVASFGLLDIACEVSAISGKRAVKFHPKPKLYGKGTDYEAGSVPLPPDTSTVPSEVDPFPQRPHDPDFPPSFDGTFPIDPSEDCVLNSNQNQVSEESHGACQPDDAVSDEVADLESVPNMADLEDVENITSHSYQDEGFVSTAGEANEIGNYSSKLRKRKVAQEFVSGMDTIASDAERSMDGPLDEDVGADENDLFGQVENGTSRNKGSRPRSMTDATGNNKPARKRKKKAEACDQSDKQPPKRLPHSTRRKKRMVDKSFLEMPDDEIEFHTVPLRDLIIRAEIKQRQAKKASTTVNPPSTNERSNSTMRDNPYDDDHAFASEPGMSTEDNMSVPNVKVHNADYYNYHTYMEKKSTKRWSKQETELFYKAVSQFGSDFSMIKQLFDGRSRQQIKSKYKKEERQNPMRLLDALTYKAKDLSHFERALYAAEKAMRSQATQQDGAADMAGDEDAMDSHPETDADTPMEEATPPEGADFTQASVDETEKSDEQKEESAVADEVPEEYYTGSPAEDDDIDGLFCDYNG